MTDDEKARVNTIMASEIELEQADLSKDISEIAVGHCIYYFITCLTDLVLLTVVYLECCASRGRLETLVTSQFHGCRLCAGWIYNHLAPNDLSKHTLCNPRWLSCFITRHY